MAVMSWPLKLYFMKERKHSKFSASGASRWMACSGSVALSETQPERPSKWAEEGTEAHAVLEYQLKRYLRIPTPPVSGNADMDTHAYDAARFIIDLREKGTKGPSEFLVETRIELPFIHPEMFGTFDAGVVEHFGTLHVIDYKYGAGKMVSPVDNLQMIFYGMGLAHKYDWNFARIKLWIIQPRIKGYDGPLFWEMSIHRLMSYVDVFKKAVERVLKHPNQYVEGAHCHWCRAKAVCPLKTKREVEETQNAFLEAPSY